MWKHRINAARMLRLPALLLVLVSSAAIAGGRPSSSPGPWYWDIKGQWNLAQGDYSDIVDDGFGLGGSVIYWPSDRPFGLQFDITYNDYDIGNSAIRAINDAIEDIDDPAFDDISVTGGDISDWSFMFNGIWSPGGGSADGFYLSAGIGMSILEGRLRDTGLVYYPPLCDPWWWWCIPGGVGPGSFVIASESTTEFAWNVGAGYSFELNGGSILFFEAKYRSIETSRTGTEMVPLTFGIRF